MGGVKQNRMQDNHRQCGGNGDANPRSNQQGRHSQTLLTFDPTIGSQSMFTRISPFFRIFNGRLK